MKDAMSANTMRVKMTAGQKKLPPLGFEPSQAAPAK